MNPAPFRLSRQSKVVIFTACLAALLEIIDTAIVNVALPTMMGNLGTTLENISWVVTGYIIANAIVLPIATWLGLRIGRREYYVTCILLFTAASGLCGLAPNLPTLVAFRILQGLAGGALIPTSQALIQEQFPRDRAGTGSAIYGMSIMVGPTIGPILGGYLTDQFGWRSIFFINLPLGLLAASLAWTNVKNVPDASGATNNGATKLPLDGIGLALLAIGIGALQFVLERGQPDNWFESHVILIWASVAGFALPAFVFWELHVAHPIVNVRLYKMAVVRIGSLLMMAAGLVVYSTIFLIPIFVSRLFDYTATQTGILFVPGALLTIVAMPFVGVLMRKVDARLLIFIGITLSVASLATMTHFNAATGDGEMLLPLLLRGLAIAFYFVSVNTVVLSQFSGVALGQVAGLMNLLRQLGGSIAIAGISTVLQRSGDQYRTDLSGHLSAYDPAVHAFLGKADALAPGALQPGGWIPDKLSLALLSHRIETQVFVLSFDHIAAVLSIVFAGTYIMLLFLKRPRGPLAKPVDIH